MSSLAFRHAAEGDWFFIRDSWLESFRDSHAAGPIPMPMYRRIYRDVILATLARPGVEVWVAHHPGEADTKADLYGWLCIELGHIQPVVHYAFVKQAFRRLSIMRGLFAAAHVRPDEALIYTWKTAVVTKLAGAIPRGRWDPMVARYPKKTTPEDLYGTRQQAIGAAAVERK